MGSVRARATAWASLWPTRARLGIGPPLTREADNDRSRQLRWVEAGPCRCRQCSTQSDPQIGSDAPLKGRYIDLLRVTIGYRWDLFGAAYSGLQTACMVCALFVCCRQHGITSYLQPCPTRSSAGCERAHQACAPADRRRDGHLLRMGRPPHEKRAYGLFGA